MITIITLALIAGVSIHFVENNQILGFVVGICIAVSEFSGFTRGRKK